MKQTDESILKGLIGDDYDESDESNSDIEEIEPSDQSTTTSKQYSLDIPETDVSSTQNNPEKEYFCKQCDFSTPDKLELGRHVKNIHNAKKKQEPTTQKTERKDSDYLDEMENLRTILDNAGLKRRADAVIEAFSYRDPSDLRGLGQLLKMAGAQISSQKLILTNWANYLGMFNEDVTKYISAPNTIDPYIDPKNKEEDKDDTMKLIQQLKKEEITDAYLEKYRAEMETKSLENKLKLKKLESPSDDSDYYILEEPIYNMNGTLKTNEAGVVQTRKVKYPTSMLQNPFMQNNGIDDLKKELTELKYNQKPPYSQEIESLKQEIAYSKKQAEEDRKLHELKEESRKERDLLLKMMDDQNKRNEELVRSVNDRFKSNPEESLLRQELMNMKKQTEEDRKFHELKEESRKERELILKMIDDQSKRNEEMIRSIQEKSKSQSSEEILSKKIETMQSLFNEQLHKLTSEVFQSQKEKELNDKIERLNEENKRSRDDSQSQIGQLADTMKSFANDMTHAFERTMIEKEHDKEKAELKKKIDEAYAHSNMSKEERAVERGIKMLEKAGSGVGETIESVIESAKPSIAKNAEITAMREKAAMVNQYKDMGFTPEQISKLMEPKSNVKPPHIDAKAEWERMNRIVQKQDSQMQTKPSLPLPSIDTDSNYSDTEVQFIDGD